MLDILASEYGWTPDYVLNGLTRKQVEVLLDAINRRYLKQKEALEKDDTGASDGQGSHVHGKGRNVPESIMAKFGGKEMATRK